MPPKDREFFRSLSPNTVNDIGTYDYLSQNYISTGLEKGVLGLPKPFTDERDVILFLIKNSILELDDKVGEKETNLRYDIIIIPEKMNIRIRVLHAIDYPEIAKKFQTKHTKVLEEFGLEIGSTKNKWWEYSGSYMVIAEDIDTGEIGAGMRLDMIDATHDIPMEEAIERFNPEFKKIIHKYDNILAEVSALWTTKSFSERKLPARLLRAGISVSSKLRINTLVGFPHESTIKITDKLGFTPVDYIDGLGEKGSFNYPYKSKDKSYKSTLVELEDTYNLPTMSEEERDFIVWLRSHPIQKINEEVRGRKTNLEYDLRIM